jgi:hypothetical protein
MALTEATVAELGPRLVVIDTLGLALGSLEENDAAAIGPVMTALCRIRDRHGCAVLVVHHVTKDTTRSPLARVRGSGAIGAAADAVLCLSSRDDPKLVEVRSAKQRDGDVGRPVRLQIAPIPLEGGRTGVHLVAGLEGSEEPDGSPGDSEAIVKALRMGPAPSLLELQRRIGLSQARVRKAVDQAVRAGLVSVTRTARSTTYSLAHTE